MIQTNIKHVHQTLLSPVLLIVDDTESMDLHNLQLKSKKGRLPSCSKARKMGFPYDPEVLNLMSLEE